MKPECNIVKIAESLTSRIETRDLPPDFDPGDEWYNQILACIRHEYTNYEQLLWELPLCVDFWDEHGSEYCRVAAGCSEQEWGRGFYPCPLQEWAHDILKWAAKAAAEKVYSEFTPDQVEQLAMLEVA